MRLFYINIQDHVYYHAHFAEVKTEIVIAQYHTARKAQARQ